MFTFAFLLANCGLFDLSLKTAKSVIDWSIIKYKKYYKVSLLINVVTYGEQNIKHRNEISLSRDIHIFLLDLAKKHNDSLEKKNRVCEQTRFNTLFLSVR